MNAVDRRITPVRDDLAAEHLRGKIDAPRYARGGVREIVRGTAALRRAPDEGSALDTQLFYGERFTVYEERDGWVWGQAESDGYVGYVRADALAEPGSMATHRVIALRTPVFPAADLKRPPVDFLPLNALVVAAEIVDRYARLCRGGFVARVHLAARDWCAPDWVAVAERFLGVPYLWGGKDAGGLDCSGLIQTALAAAGIKAPRDTDMMEENLGSPVAASTKLAGLRRGDLIFWKGHVGVMLDATRFLHANAFHMEVAAEPIAAAAARIERAAGPLTSVRRL